MVKQWRYTNEFNGVAKFMLFLSSYAPLFFLIGFKQIYTNRLFLHWGGFSWDSVSIWFENFALATVLIIVALVGIFGVILIFRKLSKDSVNGNNVTVVSVGNKNSESIGYIATYIVPFLFENFNSMYELIALSILLLIIYNIYVNSSLLLVNPILNFNYSIYEITYKLGDKERTGLLISKKCHMIYEEDKIKIYEIGYKLYYKNN
ncbi:MAG: hypothetical protein R3Y59_08045 [bacterium]